MITIEEIKALLANHLGSLPTVAKQIGLPLRTIYNIHYGKTKNPGSSTYQKLVKWASKQRRR